MAELEFLLKQAQYEALIALAREGTKTPDGQIDAEKSRRLDSFLGLIEKQNGINRDFVYVQWQELDEPMPPNTNFPDVWPPEKRHYIELITRKVARADVERVLAAKARVPHNVLVTKDPGGRVGWTPLSQFFVN